MLFRAGILTNSDLISCRLSKEFRLVFVRLAEITDTVSCSGKEKRRLDFVQDGKKARLGFVQKLPGFSAYDCRSSRFQILKPVNTTISCIRSRSTKGIPCDAKKNRFPGYFCRLDESHVSFLLCQTNCLTDCNGGATLSSVVSSNKAMLFRRVTARSKVGFAIISAIFVPLSQLKRLHDAKSEYGQNC